MKNNTTPAPVILFTYNRPRHTRQTVEALQKNELAEQSDLTVFSDAAKNHQTKSSVQEVRDYLKTIQGFKSVKIIERKENLGLAKSIISGVTEIVNIYGRVIVLEDDLVTGPYFLRFMNDGLEMYQDEQQVASIHGYVYPIKNLPQTFFIRGADCWGWATWKDRWSVFESDGKKLLDEIVSKKLQNEFDFNGSYPYVKMLEGQIAGKNNSWAIRWYASTFLKNMFTLYPGKSHVQNIGHDSSATHTRRKIKIFDVELCEEFVLPTVIEIKESREARKLFVRYLQKIKIKSFFMYLAKMVFPKIELIK